ncbi:MAG: isochorismatase family protein [Wenzhouxiangellaceae bacterium]
MIDEGLPRLAVETSLLLVVDVQGRLARLVHQSERMIRRQRVLIRGCRALGVPVLWAEQLPDKLGSTVDELQESLEGLQPFCKSSFGCLGDAALARAIEDSGRQQILLCGIETHICVWQTAAALKASGREVHLIIDATSSRDPESRQVGIQRMRSIGVWPSVAEMALFELMRDATHPKFREIVALLKDEAA